MFCFIQTCFHLFSVFETQLRVGQINVFLSSQGKWKEKVTNAAKSENVYFCGAKGYVFALLKLSLMNSNETELTKWLNNNLSAADYSHHSNGSRAVNGRKGSARWKGRGGRIN